MATVASSPLVIAVVLNWNNAQETIACLESLERSTYSNCQSLVVDNGSTDSSVRDVLECYPDVDVLRCGENLGYAAGNNRAIRYALQQKAEWVLILNNDVRLAPDCVEQLVLATGEGPDDVGALSPLVYHADSERLIQAAGGRWTGDLDYQWSWAGQEDPGTLERPEAVDLLPGCALFLKREAIERIGLFDERFFMYREDIDLCLRLTRAGYGLYLIPQAHVWHRRPRTGIEVPPHVVYYMARNSLLLAAKHHRFLSAVRFLWRDLTAWGLWTFSPRWRAMRTRARARADGVRDFFLGRFGCSERWSPV